MQQHALTLTLLRPGTGLALTPVFLGIALLVFIVVVLVALWWRCRTRFGLARWRLHYHRVLRGKLDDDSAELATSSAVSYGSLSPVGRTDPNEVTWWEDIDLLAIRVPFEALQIDRVLDRGGLGEVYHAIYQGQDVAVKRLLPERRAQRHQVLLFVEEAKFLAALDHERLVGLLGVAWAAARTSTSDPHVVVEFMAGGDLQAALTRFEQVERRAHGLDPFKLQIAAQILEGLAFLHAQHPPIVHGDLTARNVLLDSDGNAKLSDFGVHRDRMRVARGDQHTSLWTAPEVVLGQANDTRADVFAFGVLLAQLATHQLPYSHVRRELESGATALSPRSATREILQRVALGRERIELSPNTGPSLVALAHACVALNPQQRPTAAQALHRLAALQRPAA